MHSNVVRQLLSVLRDPSASPEAKENARSLLEVSRYQMSVDLQVEVASVLGLAAPVRRRRSRRTPTK